MGWYAFERWGKRKNLPARRRRRLWRTPYGVFALRKEQLGCGQQQGGGPAHHPCTIAATPATHHPFVLGRTAIVVGFARLPPRVAILVPMLSRMLRFAILLAVVAAIVEAIRRFAQPDAADTSPAPTPWAPLEPNPGQDNGAAAPTASAAVTAPRASSEVESANTGGGAKPGNAEPTAWVDADAEGACPASHPLKAKDSSKIVHQPGGLSYDRTHADRCYVDLAAAEADGYRAAKR